MEWMSYDLSCDADFKEKFALEEAQAEQERLSDEERAKMIRDLFMGSQLCLK
jgi:hypothetical protein